MKSLARAFALSSGFVLGVGLLGGGCYCTPCDTSDIEYIDNRDRKALPFIDEDWVCPIVSGRDLRNYKPPVPPPPPPPAHPDISGDHPASFGPKDPDGVVKAAIFINSCFGDIYYYTPRINRSIRSSYFEQLYDQSLHALFQRTDCFKEKTNGCDALRECVGIVEQINGSPKLDVVPDPNSPEGCLGDTGVEYFHDVFFDINDVYYDKHLWINCSGLGMICDDDEPREWCATPKTPCNPEVDTYSCWDTRPFYCEKPSVEGAQAWYWEEPRCGDLGLLCAGDVKSGPPYCVGAGAACELDPNVEHNLGYYSAREGFACESETMMRTCVGRGEHLVDCAQLGKGFKCIPGSPTRCGLAAECEPSDPVMCDGDSLVVCDAGKIRKVDCKSLGFTSCDAKHKVCSPGVYDNLP